MMSESTSWTPGVVAPPYYNEDCLGVAPGVAAAAYCNEEDCLCLPVYNEEHIGAVGVRFVPTDRELIVDYLARKLHGEPLPTDMVHDGHDAYAEHPKKLVPKLGKDIEGSWYLFSRRQRKYPGGMRPERAMGDKEGHWKATGAEKPVLGGAGGEEVIGTRRALTFHEDTYEAGSHGRQRRAKNRAASKPSKWKMVEFICTNSCRAPAGDDDDDAAAAPDPMLLNDFVLCKITDRSVEGGEELPTTSDGGEPYGEHLPELQQASGGTQAGQQQQGPSGGGAASHAPAEEAQLPDCGHGLGDIFSMDLDSWFANPNSMFPIFGSYDAQTAAGQQ